MDDAIASVRKFNRFFTQWVGALDGDFLGMDISLPQARVLFEIATAGGLIAADLQAKLDMDAGYVSRILGQLEARDWIARAPDGDDARRRAIRLTEAGAAAFAELDRRQRDKVAVLLDRLTPNQCAELTQAFDAARLLLAGPAERAFSLRPFRTGDLGMAAARQSMFYREAYGWGPQIEVIINDMTSAFLHGFKPGREQCWVAEVEGRMAGSVMLTDEGEGLARLRLLYVEPWARGLGIGDALVAACVGFARETGYRAMSLWTHAILEGARRLYAAHGLSIVEAHEHELFGAPVQSETWRIEFVPQPAGGAAAP